jgi:hypothetical protein
MDEILKYIVPILTALVSGFFLLKVHDMNRTKSRLLSAYRDIEFLQCVERRHVEAAVAAGRKSTLRSIRKQVRENDNLIYSGMSPNTVKYKIKKMEDRISIL